MKAALNKCVELRISTEDYRHYLPELDQAWESVEPFGESEDESEVVVKEPIEEQHVKKGEMDQIREARAEISVLTAQLSELTLAVNALRIDQASGVAQPPATTCGGQVTTTTTAVGPITTSVSIPYSLPAPYSLQTTVSPSNIYMYQR